MMKLADGSPSGLSKTEVTQYKYEFPFYLIYLSEFFEFSLKCMASLHLGFPETFPRNFYTTFCPRFERLRNFGQVKS